MKNLFITSAVAIAFTVPTMADNVQPNIAVGTNPADCTEPVLGTTSGTSNLEANWSANTLNIDWYDGDTKITSTTCTYDGGIVVPSEEPEKTGYTFNGWTIRRAAAAPSQPQQTTFDLSTLNASTDGSSYSYIKFDGTASKANSSGTRKAASAHSITENGELAVEFSYGTVKGIARCSLVPGSSTGQNGNPTDDLNTEGAQYCWCQVTGFDDDKDGTYQSVVSSLWAFDNVGYESAADCASSCTVNCGLDLRNNMGLRTGLFGTAQ